MRFLDDWIQDVFRHEQRAFQLNFLHDAEQFRLLIIQIRFFSFDLNNRYNIEITRLNELLDNNFIASLFDDIR